MICHIVQNGGYMFLILSLCIAITKSTSQVQTLTVQEFCSRNLLHNIEPDEPYVIVLKNANSFTGINKWFHKSKKECHQKFLTSDPAAHFEIAITNMDIPSCNGSCRCGYFEISVSGYRKRFCGHVSREQSFKSKSNTLSIEFHPASMMPFNVTLAFTAKRNFYIITGIPKDESSDNFIETPYFPNSCPSNYRVEYMLQSNVNAHVMLLFLDFQVSHQSFIEVTGNNGTRSSRFYGNVFRPPVFVSQSNHLALKFESNEQSGMAGFRAEFSFIKNTDHLLVPYTDCGGLKEGLDGYLYIKTHEEFGLYDCVWNIMSSALSTKSYLSVLIQLRFIGHKSNLEFRKGLNSKAEIVEKFDCENENCRNLDAEIVVLASQYLHIRFSGYLDQFSVVNMTYSTFHRGNCSNNEFKCNDGRCLLSDFRCDGIKHCPNGTDEDTCPSSETFEDNVTHHPTVETSSFNKDAIYEKFFFVMVFCCIGLVTVLISICIFVFNRCKSTTTEQLLPQQAVGELSSIQPTVCPVNSYECDNLPSYEDFIKSSADYPPLLYTRATQRFVPKDKCTQCTTSFCTGARVRHYSADTGSDIFLNITGNDSHLTQPPASNRYNIEINQNLAFKELRNTIKRSLSLDSKLNDLINKDSCNFFLSIIHPVSANMSNQLPHIQCHTLPSNFKMNSFKPKYYEPKMNRSSSLQHSTSVNFSKDRRFTWSFVPHRSVGSELVTIVKTRCFSDPCNGISVHYSLHQ